MSDPKKVKKEVKAWAVVSEDGNVYEHAQCETLSVFEDEFIAEKYHWKPQRVVRCTITYEVER